MKTNNPDLDLYRVPHPVLGSSEGLYGYFEIKTFGGKLRVISSGPHSNESEWEHVSVSLPNRTPMWSEMNRVKDLFWGDDETVIQFHPRKTEYVNDHPFCLHLWRHKDGHETPPIDHV